MFKGKVRVMKKRFISVILILLLTAATIVPAAAVSMEIDGTPVPLTVTLYNGTSYVPLRAAAKLICSDAAVTWENGTAVIRNGDLTVTARPGAGYIEANGRLLYAENGVRLTDGTTTVPVRVLAKALDAAVTWDGATGTVTITSGSGTIESGDSFYSADEVYWLSRIINAESSGEPLRGKIAVGNVILNRVKSPDFPDTIYGVIFDSRWGGQFEPAKNGTIYNTPDAESVLAAKLCLDGASVAGTSLYFLNPALSTNFWIMDNRSRLTTIGNHAFYA
jgi:N-acetylmuramoyl-L-alanine amidase